MKTLRALTFITLALFGLKAVAAQCDYQIDDQAPVALAEQTPNSNIFNARFLVQKMKDGTTSVLTGERLDTFLSQATQALDLIYLQEQNRALSCYGWCASSPTMMKNILNSVVDIRIHEEAGTDFYQIAFAGTNNMSEDGRSKE